MRAATQPVQLAQPIPSFCYSSPDSPFPVSYFFFNLLTEFIQTLRGGSSCRCILVSSSLLGGIQLSLRHRGFRIKPPHRTGLKSIHDGLLRWGYIDLEDQLVSGGSFARDGGVPP